jgi:acyl-CoA synthetase (AMP-forming)/AMP-acid ligase II
VILQAVARHASSCPDVEAVVTPHERVAYGELAARVSRRAEGFVAGAIQPVQDGDGLAFTVDFLAALQAGASPLILHRGETLAVGACHDPREVLLPTSGSTAEPRIARLSEKAVAWNAGAHAGSVGLGGPGHRILVAGALAHAATLVAQVVAGLQLGATLVFASRPFTAKGFLETAAAERVTATAPTPAHVRLLLEPRADAAWAALDLSALRIVTIGSAPIDPEAVWQIRRLLPGSARVFLTYGLTEAGPRVTTLSPEDFALRPESVGRPLPGVAVKLDPGGELLVRTPGRMEGYLGEPPLAGEWLRTGDLATIDTGGFVTLRGRLKEIIVSGGAKISPREVEHALCQDRRVREAAVVPEPHPILGEVAKAFVVLAGPLDADEILAALATRLSPHKLPRRLVIVDALPCTPAGKVDKRRLIAGP